MKSSISRRRPSIAIAVLCLFLAAIIQAQPAKIDASASLPKQLVFPDAPIVLDDRSLDGALEAYSPLVLDCWEVGCRPCQKVRPIIDQMANDFRGKIVFGKLCADTNPITLARYGVSRTPTLLIFENGAMVYKHVGYYPREELERIILAALHMSR